MQPRQDLYANVEKLNTVLRQELGQPVYSWQWSGDIKIAVREEDAAGKPRFEYVKDPDTGLLIAQPAYWWREICAPQVEDQWVLCRKIYRSRALFLAMFGSSLLWPENGEWQPLCAGTGYVALPKSTDPDSDETWEAIRLIRRENEETPADQRARIEAAIDRRERRTNQRRRDYIRNKIPVFGGIPGTKMDYSFGGFEAPKEKEKAPAV